jgi:hypothetical protein
MVALDVSLNGFFGDAGIQEIENDVDVKRSSEQGSG